MTLLQVSGITGGWSDFLMDYVSNGLVDNIVLQCTAKVTLIAIFLGIMFYLITLSMNYLRTSIGKFVNPDMGFFIDFDDLFRTIGILCLICLYIPLMTLINGTVNMAYHMTKPSGAEYDALNENTKELQKVGKAFYMETDYNTLLVIKKSYEANQNTYSTEAYNYAVRQIKKIDAAKSTEISANTNQASTGTPSTAVVPTDDSGGKDEGIFSKVFGGIGFVIMKILNTVVGLALELIMDVIKYIVILMAKIWLKILFIFGPLALAFSILPMFKKQGEIWFGYYLNCAFVFLTLNILDHLFYGLNNANTLADAFNPNSNNMDLLNAEINIRVINVVMIIAYLSVFRLTSYFVGKGEAGRAIGKAAQLAGDAAKMAIAPQMAAAAAAQYGGGGAMKGAVNSMGKSSSIKDNN